MTKWSIYQSDRDHSNKRRDVVNTFELIVQLLTGSFNEIVTINRKKDK